MTEQTDAPEVTEEGLATFLKFALEPYGITVGADIIAANVIRSDWLRSALAAAEARGAERALREAAEAVRRMADQAEVDAGGKLERWDAFAEAEDLLLDRAAQVASSRVGGDS